MGFLVAERLPPTYESEATLLVGPVGANQDTLDAAGSLTRTYAGVSETATIVNRAAAQLGLTPSSVKDKVDVTASEIRLISFRASDSDPVRAAAIANAIADSLLAYSRQFGDPASPEGELQIIEHATPSTSPTGPSEQLIIPLAALAGLIAALGLAALVDSLSAAVRSEEDLAAAAPVAFLGSVDGARLNSLSRVIAADSSDSDAATGYRLLASKIELSNGDPPARSILVLDAHGGRSSVSLAANLARALAEGGARVSLIDGGERTEVARLFDIPHKANAEDRIRQDRIRPARPLRAGQVMLDRVRIKGSRLSIIRPRKALEPLELDEANEILDRVLADVDLVVLTALPVDRSPNSLVWSRAADATILVTERDHTRREQIPVALESLRVAGANVIGTVLCKGRIL
jgi:polysaccharide biosynthesis transport protein